MALLLKLILMSFYIIGWNWQQHWSCSSRN